jgi:hypothetical protein
MAWVASRRKASTWAQVSQKSALSMKNARTSSLPASLKLRASPHGVA